MDFLQALERRAPLVADGATGTMLQQWGLPTGEPPERWTLENPEALQRLACQYAQAGSDLVYTNTFGANRIRLRRFGLDGKVGELNRLAVRLAKGGVREALHARPLSPFPRPFIVGSIGPTGELLEPYGDLSPKEAKEAFAEQALALAEEGVDAIICETFTDLNEAVLCLRAVRAVVKVPVMVSMSFEPGGRTMMGVTPEEALRRLWDEGAVVVGANCSVGPGVVEKAIEAMRKADPKARLLAKPNAGTPQFIGGKLLYPVSPPEMANFAERMKGLGVAVIGGCCGTTPHHIAAMAKALRGT